MTRIISINVAAIRKGIRKVPKTPELKEPRAEKATLKLREARDGNA